MENLHTSISRNAIIMAAGTASRFVPLSAERPKGLLEVKGEILIERQIRQLQEAGITDITIVVGYRAELFTYLQEKFGVNLVLNEDYACYNNTSSLVRVADRLADTYICCSDNYFPHNVFLENPQESYYAARYAAGPTGEYCLITDEANYIRQVTIGGTDAWYMNGHVYFNQAFSQAFSRLLIKEYDKPETRNGYWEDLYIRHIDELPLMKIHKYEEGSIYEADSLDELRLFDTSYLDDTRSTILKQIAQQMNWRERDMSHFTRVKHEGKDLRFTFQVGTELYLYDSHFPHPQRIE